VRRGPSIGNEYRTPTEKEEEEEEKEEEQEKEKEDGVPNYYFIK
jgi:hypothetical protein